MRSETQESVFAMARGGRRKSPGRASQRQQIGQIAVGFPVGIDWLLKSLRWTQLIVDRLFLDVRQNEDAPRPRPQYKSGWLTNPGGKCFFADS